MKHARVTESWSRYNVPEDLWREILSRLPVKSLLRFRCVSRSWQSLISDPDFHCLHLNQFRNNCDETHLFVVQGLEGHCMIRCGESFQITENLGRLRKLYGSSKKDTTTATLFDGHWYILFSADGLVLLQNSSHKSQELMLWNPSIKKTRRLPPSPGDSFPSSCLGLGFDPLINDYKILRAGRDHTGSHFIAVYTVGTNSWKTIWPQGKGPSCCYWPPYSRRFVYSKGRLYYLGLKSLGAKVVVSFDLSNEIFASITLPPHEDPRCPVELMLVDGGCSLALFQISIDEGSIWVLEGCGDSATSMHWTKRCTFALTVPRFLYLKKNGDMLLGYKKVTMYNIQIHKEKQLPKFRNPIQTKNVWGFKESLFLLN